MLNHVHNTDVFNHFLLNTNKYLFNCLIKGNALPTLNSQYAAHCRVVLNHIHNTDVFKHLLLNTNKIVSN